MFKLSLIIYCSGAFLHHILFTVCNGYDGLKKFKNNKLTDEEKKVIHNECDAIMYSIASLFLNTLFHSLILWPIDFINILICLFVLKIN
jgi:hypothetical protein